MALIVAKLFAYVREALCTQSDQYMCQKNQPLRASALFVCAHSLCRYEELIISY